MPVFCSAPVQKRYNSNRHLHAYPPDTTLLKLHRANPSGINIFSGYGDGFVLVNGKRIDRSVVVLPERIIDDWGATTFEALTAAHLEALAGLEREVILLGTGNTLRFPRPELMRAIAPRLAKANIGLEIMDVQAACRTYNILIAEERRVAAALLIE